MAAQFESWVHPFTIMLTVPLATFGGIIGILVAGSSLNIYSQIGLIILIGLAAKNGILIVEFANQLRIEGQSIEKAIVNSCKIRLRPILMTSLSTIAGGSSFNFRIRSWRSKQTNDWGGYLFWNDILYFLYFVRNPDCLFNDWKKHTKNRRDRY